MKKYVKYIIGIIVIIAIVVVYNMFYDKVQNNLMKNESTVTNGEIEETEKNEIQNEVIPEKNLDNDIENNEIEQIEENKPAEEKNQVVDKTTSGTAVYEEKSDIGSTDKKQEAINLVMQKWGEDNTVTFRCDSVENNGEYIIAVVSKTSARVQNYFRVNLEKKSVIVDY